MGFLLPVLLLWLSAFFSFVAFSNLLPPIHPQVQFMVWLPRLVHFSHPYPSEYLPPPPPPPPPTPESNTHRFDLVRRSLLDVCVLTKGVDK